MSALPLLTLSTLLFASAAVAAPAGKPRPVETFSAPGLVVTYPKGWKVYHKHESVEETAADEYKKHVYYYKYIPGVPELRETKRWATSMIFKNFVSRSADEKGAMHPSLAEIRDGNECSKLNGRPNPFGLPGCSNYVGVVDINGGKGFLFLDNPGVVRGRNVKSSEVIFEKGADVYMLVFTAPAEYFDGLVDDFDVISSRLKID